MNQKKVKPIKRLITGNIVVLDEQEQLILNHLRNNNIGSVNITNYINKSYQHIRDKLNGIYMYMEAIDQ